MTTVTEAVEPFWCNKRSVIARLRKGSGETRAKQEVVGVGGRGVTSAVVYTGGVPLGWNNKTRAFFILRFRRISIAKSKRETEEESICAGKVQVDQYLVPWRQRGTATVIRGDVLFLARRLTWEGWQAEAGRAAGDGDACVNNKQGLLRLRCWHRKAWETAINSIIQDDI